MLLLVHEVMKKTVTGKSLEHSNYANCKITARESPS